MLKNKRNRLVMDKAEEVRKLVADRLQKHRLEMKEVSIKYLRKSHAYIHQYLNKKVPRQLAYEDRIILAPLLGLREEDLRVDEIREFGDKSRKYVPPSVISVKPELVSDATLIASKLGLKDNEVREVAMQAAEMASQYNHEITEDLVKHLIKVRRKK